MHNDTVLLPNVLKNQNQQKMYVVCKDGWINGCMCVYMYVSMYVLYVGMYVHVCMYLCMYASIHVCMHVCMYVCMYVCVCVRKAEYILPLFLYKRVTL